VPDTRIVESPCIHVTLHTITTQTKQTISDKDFELQRCHKATQLTLAIHTMCSTSNRVNGYQSFATDSTRIFSAKDILECKDKSMVNYCDLLHDPRNAFEPETTHARCCKVFNDSSRSKSDVEEQASKTTCV
jgi:hypothetical protein